MPPKPAHDRPGPHPENQRKRQELVGARHGLVGVLAISAVLAIIGGVRAGSPLLAVLVGGSQGVAAWLVLARQIHCRLVALGAALLAIGWAVTQILVLDGVSWFSLSLLGVGLLEVLLVAGSTPRDDGTRKKMRGRR
jgi:hypothetical protein